MSSEMPEEETQNSFAQDNPEKGIIGTLRDKAREAIKGKELSAEVLRSAITEAYDSIDKSKMGSLSVDPVGKNLDQLCDMALKGMKVKSVEGGMYSLESVVEYLDLNAAVLRKAAEILNKDFNIETISTTAKSFEQLRPEDRQYVKKRERDEKIDALKERITEKGNGVVGGVKKIIGRGE